MCTVILFQWELSPATGAAHEREPFHRACGGDLACKAAVSMCLGSIYLQGEWEELSDHLRPSPAGGHSPRGQAKQSLQVRVTFQRRERHYIVGKCKQDAGCNHHWGLHPGRQCFVCRECGGSFTSGHGLLCHQRVHTGERLQIWSKCEKSFNHK